MLLSINSSEVLPINSYFSQKLLKNMKNSIYSIFFSLEPCMLFILLISSIYSIFIVNENKFSDLVYQFNSFQEQVDATISCSPNTTTTATTNSVYKTFNASLQTSTLPRCPIDDERLRLFDDYDLFDTQVFYEHIKHGGHFKPVGCEPRQKVAIIVPYRDRQDQLVKFSLYIHQFLPDQLVQYSLYVIEQADELPFNRAKLFNIGYNEIIKLNPEICCFIFHDVDLIPLNQRNLYMCSTRPRHLSSGVSTLRYKLLYPSMFGGVIAMTKEQFKTVDGFSNVYFGWGGEDDDMFKRIVKASYTIQRTPEKSGVYVMLRHSKMKPNPMRFQLLKGTGQNSDASGVKRLGPYKVKGITEKELFTIISVNL